VITISQVVNVAADMSIITMTMSVIFITLLISSRVVTVAADLSIITMTVSVIPTALSISPRVVAVAIAGFTISVSVHGLKTWRVDEKQGLLANHLPILRIFSDSR
jgi:hypothetical protein